MATATPEEKLGVVLPAVPFSAKTASSASPATLLLNQSLTTKKEDVVDLL